MFVPFWLTSEFDSFFVSRLGANGAKAFSNSLLLFIPSLIVVFGLHVFRRTGGKKLSVID